MKHLLEYEEYEQLNEAAADVVKDLLKKVSLNIKSSTKKYAGPSLVVICGVVGLIMIVSRIGTGVSKTIRTVKTGGKSVLDNHKVKVIIKRELTLAERMGLFVSIKKLPQMIPHTAQIKKAKNPEQRKRLIGDMIAMLLEKLSGKSLESFKRVLTECEKEGIIGRGWASPVYYQNKI